MKKQFGGIKGPKVRYFNHRHGAVSARKPIMRSVVLPVLMTVAMMGGGFFGFAEYENARSRVVRANESAQVTQAAEQVEKQEPVQDQKPRQAKEDKDIAKSIKKKIDAMPRNTMWAVSVRDLKSERMANINADEQVQAGQLGTMFVLSALERKQPTERWGYKMNTQTIESCVINMIKASDTNCAEALGSRADWKNIDPMNKGLGFPSTSVRSDGKHTTTAREVSDLMYRLQNSQLLGDKARRVVFDGLYSQKSNEGVPKACGTNCLVAHKTSDQNELKHDAAIVTQGDRQYVVVIMSTGTTWAQVSDVAKTVHEQMKP